MKLILESKGVRFSEVLCERPVTTQLSHTLCVNTASPGLVPALVSACQLVVAGTRVEEDSDSESRPRVGMCDMIGLHVCYGCGESGCHAFLLILTAK